MNQRDLFCRIIPPSSLSSKNHIHHELCTNQSSDVDRMTREFTLKPEKYIDTLKCALHNAVDRGHSLCTKYLLSIWHERDKNYLIRLMIISMKQLQADVFCILLNKNFTQDEVDCAIRSFLYISTPTAAPDRLCRIMQHIINLGFCLEKWELNFNERHYFAPGNLKPLLLCPNVLLLVLLKGGIDKYTRQMIKHVFVIRASCANTSRINSPNCHIGEQIFDFTILQRRPYAFHHSEHFDKICKTTINMLHKLGFLKWDEYIQQTSKDFNPSLEPKIGRDFERRLCQDMQKLLHNPLSLKDQCRLSLLRKLDVRYLQAVRSLSTELPESVVQYLLGSDLVYQYDEFSRLNEAAIVYKELTNPGPRFLSEASDYVWNLLATRLGEYLEKWVEEKPTWVELEEFFDVVKKMLQEKQVLLTISLFVD